MRQDDFDAVNEFFRRQQEPVVELQPVFGRPPAAELLDVDGLHPSPARKRSPKRSSSA